MIGSVHEECGIFGIFGNAGVSLPATVYYGLFALQHRGQESSGMAVSDGKTIKYHKAMGLVSDVFTHKIIEEFGDPIAAIGHNRYSTTGSSTAGNAQPLVLHYAGGTFSICHNGNLTNCDSVRRQLEGEGSIFHTTVDSEVIAQLIAKKINKGATVKEAVKSVMDNLRGGYAVLVMTGDSLTAFRDPHGIKPLCMGRLGDAYVFASESCALASSGADFIRDVEPGEIITVNKDGMTVDHTERPCSCNKCVFEYIYFARADSRMDGISVYESRLRAGRLLARQYPVEADCVIGVPESGLDAAMGYSSESGIPYVKGFVKNSYVGRTFIKPSQELRERAVRIKLNPISEAVEGKRVIMIDDSIVRGTTMANLVKMLRQAGATEVHVRISAPPFLFPCYYGTDVPSKENLIACHNTIEQIRGMIGADSLGYLNVESLHEMLGEEGHSFCDACFTGHYPEETESL